MTSHSLPCELERDLLALPTRIGGMGIVNPVKMCASEFSASNNKTYEAFAISLLSWTDIFTSDNWSEQFSIKKRNLSLEALCNFFQQNSSVRRSQSQFKRSIDLASEKGASNWLTVLPYCLHRFYAFTYSSGTNLKLESS